MREIPLAEFGLVSVSEVCDAYGWAPKTVQNWIRADLLPVLVIGTGRSARFLLRAADVEAFTPPARGRPPKPEPPPATKRPARRGKR